MARIPLLLLALATRATGAWAGVLSLSHDEAAQRLRVYDGATPSAAFVVSTGLGVQAGSVAADAAGDRVFFIANRQGAQTLHSLGYGPFGGVEHADLPGSLRVTHLEWDGSGTPRLVGAAIRAADEAAVLVRFQGGVLSELGMPQAGCCAFRGGVSAFRASDDSLFLVGRLEGESQDRLFRFTLGSAPAVDSAFLEPDLTVLELAVAADGQLYGLGHSQADARTRLLAFDAALAVQTRGDGSAACCFVLAGAAAIDPGTGELVAFGSAIAPAAPGPTRLWRFALATGDVFDGGVPAAGVGLFHDPTPILPGGDLFGDGFESGPPLPRPDG